ncbi:cytochrome P450 family protein [Allonocardiopsis opalescens]|uniref:Cytochrome P450 n=1 Tax=Allonocardiopsis opalescens TaxID=1144618 RepID=A0A2T0Q1S3_9ACTN|nr:cytochrome P450 [Allonocardiopsis opalescens]PRX97747.1 cytochrome P450 [Allonocardiopsis opalescens]
MAGTGTAADVPEIDLTGAEVLRDPVAAYGAARERGPVVRITAPGMPPMWALTRHADAKAMLGDHRFAIGADSFMRPDVSADLLPYLRTMSEMPAAEHTRLRKLVAPAFTVRRAADFRPRVEPIVDRLLDGLAEQAARAADGTVDLLPHFARPLPMDVICELVGIPEADRPRWREYGAAVAAGHGQGFADAVPGIIDGARAAVARRRAEPADDLLGGLIRAQADDGDRLSDTEMAAMVWQLVLSGQTPTNLIANAVAALLTRPDQLVALRADPALLPGAVEELVRWCGPGMLTIPRRAREDVELHGVRVPAGEPVVAVIAAANRDPRAFAEPDRLDVRRRPGQAAHLGFAHGPHFCLGAALARMQTEVALGALLRRFPGLALAVPPERVRPAPDPGTLRTAEVPVRL